VLLRRRTPPKVARISKIFTHHTASLEEREILNGEITFPSPFGEPFGEGVG